MKPESAAGRELEVPIKQGVVVTPRVGGGADQTVRRRHPTGWAEVPNNLKKKPNNARESADYGKQNRC
jgi:hypothetical protein